jgi:hypothetical protein
MLTTHISGLPPNKKTLPTDSLYTMRLANANDLQALEELIYAARPSSDLFSGPGPEALAKQLKWLLGKRDPAFAQSPMYAKTAPFFVLEKESTDGDGKHIVAAAGAQSAPSSAFSIHPLLWDGRESAVDVVNALVQHLIKAAGDISGDASKCVMAALVPCRVAHLCCRLATITWVLSEGHPLRRWLLAAQLAVENPRTSLYDSHGTWWINVLSLPLFASAIHQALNARLQRAQHVIGQTYSAELRVAELRKSVPGVVIKIRDAEVAYVEEYTLSDGDLKTSGKPRLASTLPSSPLSFAQHFRVAGPTLACLTARSCSCSWDTARGRKPARSSQTPSPTPHSCRCSKFSFRS